mmetsp:Transcript_20500/g.28830  ORF Transcript_20500/g.28830 Transcript_20500/m.28830 type:complete len:110 (+) Transcript_20500:2297-2626(+)
MIPFTRECLNNEALAHEVQEDTDESRTLKQLEIDYQDCAEKCVQAGFNPIFDATLPVAYEPNNDMMDKNKKLKAIIDNNQMFNPSSLFLTLGNMCANSEDLLMAQESFD